MFYCLLWKTRFSPLFLALIQDRDKIVKLLIDYGADLTAKNSNGETIFHYWPFMGKKMFTYLLDLMIDRGLIDVNQKYKDGQTLLHHLHECVYINEFLKRGADLNIRSKDGKYPEHNCRNEECTIVELIQRLRFVGYEVYNDTKLFRSLENFQFRKN